MANFTGSYYQRACRRTGVQLNITAIMTREQVKAVAENLSLRDPRHCFRVCRQGCRYRPGPDADHARLCENFSKDLPKGGATCGPARRELLNIIQADEVGCHIITATPDVLGKLKSLEKDLTEFSLETVQMFYDDAEVPQATPSILLKLLKQFYLGEIISMARKFNHVLVTGGSGYCGSVLVPQMLDLGYKVTVYDIQYYRRDFLPLDNPNLNRCSRATCETLRSSVRSWQDVDAVLHLACISNDASFELDENLSTTVNLGCV